MTQEKIDILRDYILQELRSTKREGIEGLIAFMDKYKFFEAVPDTHDQGKGGSANHALWTLWFARDIRTLIQRRRPEVDIPEESLILVSLCNCLFESRFPAESKLSRGERSSLAMRQSKCVFLKEELLVVERSSEESIEKGGSPSSRDSEDIIELLHFILHQASIRAIEYADGIPYGTGALKTIPPKRLDTFEEMIMDPDDHRLWMGGRPEEEYITQIDNPAVFPAHLVISVSIRQTKEADLKIFSDDYGLYALMAISEDGQNQFPSLYRSDRTAFGYKDIIVYVARFPQYRCSYVVAQNARGRWGVLSLRVNHKDNGDHLLIVEKVVDFTARSKEKAATSIAGRNGSPIRILHPGFYSAVKLPFCEK